ncbi:MAG: hypothetical protein N2595_10785 [bacterium]|nr:hypothetical protein [bacterium]
MDVPAAGAAFDGAWLANELTENREALLTAHGKVVYVHLGYGNVATTGEFSWIRLERIERPPR